MVDKKTELFMRFFEGNYGVKFVDAETREPILKEEKDASKKNRTE